jgi:hypothetical protein
MIYTLTLNGQALQVLGEALALAPLPMRITHPVVIAIQEQISAQEAAVQTRRSKPKVARMEEPATAPAAEN